ncbi:MAG: M28 family peptidase [Pseudomonadota bacterium]
MIATGALVAAALYGGLFWLLRNPVWPPAPLDAQPMASPARLERDVRALAAIEPPRNGQNVEGLDRAADHIAQAFAASGCVPALQSFELHHTLYKNVVCSFGPSDGPRVVIGAHYDVHGDHNPGADDNASGVAGVLELARMIAATAPDLGHRIDSVAFTLEEPPYFHSAEMGSYVYARRLREERAEVALMIAVEMIGYFSDEPGSQGFPLAPLAWFYPDKGNFIAVVGLLGDRDLVARVKELMSLSPEMPVYSINAPRFVTGVDFSDHWSFWQQGYPAVMVTDTAFLRNPNYHRATDRPETLDYKRMAKVVEGLYRVAVGF